MAFITKLKGELKKIVGKPVNLGRPSNCIRITLKGGKEYWCSVTSIEGDSFTINVSYAGGGSENIVVNMKEVTSFSLQ